jgi:hypothetical protein
VSDQRQEAIAELLRRKAIDPQGARAMARGSVEQRPEDATSGLGDYGRGTVEGLKQAARDIPRDAGSFLGDFFQSLLPTREGAEAGGRVVGKLGDVATLATGGLASPLGIPREAAGLARGLDVQAAPRAAVPTRQLALPAPGGAASPMRQLPAPDTKYIPGRPPTQVGQGLMPGTPGATMRNPTAATLPSVAPPAGPGQVRMPQGKPAEPLMRPDAAEGEPSQIATGLARNDPTPIDRSLTSRYRRAVKPGAPGRRDFSGTTMQDQRITTAVDSIIDARNAIRLRDANDNPLPIGRLPRSLHEFSQSIDELKGQIFDQYDNLASQQGGKGVQIPLAPAAHRLRQLVMGPEVMDLHPALAQEAEALAQRWEAAGSYSPKQMQNVVQSLNKELEGLQKNPTRETYSRATMMGQVLNTLRDTLNSTMETALQGPQYQALRNRYASLASIENDVGNAVRREAAKKPGGLPSTLGDIASGSALLHGIFTFSPREIGMAAAIKASQEMSRYLRSPNRAVTKLFSSRADALDPTVMDRMSARAATELGEMRQRQYDNMRAGNFSDIGLPRIYP